MCKINFTLLSLLILTVCGKVIQSNKISAEFGKNISASVYLNEDCIFQYSGHHSPNPIVVTVASEEAKHEYPLLIIAEHNNIISSWQIPYEAHPLKYKNITHTIAGHTLCPINLHKPSNPTITIKSGNPEKTAFSILVDIRKEFYLQLHKIYKTNISSSQPTFYAYNFTENKDENESIDAVLVKLNSNQSDCLLISIQNITCPVFDHESNIKFDSYWQTMTYQGGIIVRRNQYPEGFYIVFVLKQHNEECGIDDANVKNELKEISLILSKTLSEHEHFNIVVVTLSLFFGIFLTIVVISCTIFNIKYKFSTLFRRSQNGKKNEQYIWHVAIVILFYIVPVIQIVTTYLQFFHQTGNSDLCYYNFLCSNSWNYLYDVNHVISNAGYIILGISFFGIVHLYQLSAKNNQQQAKQNNAVCLHQYVQEQPENISPALNEPNENQEQPKSVVAPLINERDDNQGQSERNIRTLLNVPDDNQQQPERNITTVLNEPDDNQQNCDSYELFYALSLALIMEGLLSGCYHVCPRAVNFQYDTCFMYVMIVLVITNLYKSRHSGSDEQGYIIFGMLGAVTLLSEFNLTSLFSYKFQSAEQPKSVVAPLINERDDNQGQSERNIRTLLNVPDDNQQQPERNITTVLNEPDDNQQNCDSYELFYALSLALIMEGLLSGCYHVCPRAVNFQYDTCFMYVMIVLVITNLYKSRHSGSDEQGYIIFGMLGAVTLLNFIFILLKDAIWLWILFGAMQTVGFIVLPYKLEKQMLKDLYYGRRNSEIKDKITITFIIIFNALNVICVIINISYLNLNFGKYLLFMLIINCILYTTYYVIMKKVHGEQIKIITIFLFLIALIIWIGALIFFLKTLADWEESPAGSRAKNKECLIFHYYDNHDIWHFLSAFALFFTFFAFLTLDNTSRVARPQFHSH